MVDPSFASISRSLTLLLSNTALTDFEPERNGLGINNILYISMLLEYFNLRIASSKTAGQLLLIEEPEAHLHPQLQRVLYSALKDRGFQTILTTHSTHISSLAPLQSLVVLTNQGVPAIASSAASEGTLEQEEIADLERYLDATRSTLLFARKVMLVEGPAELFLIPALVKAVSKSKLDFDRLGISVIPIFGVHFEVYAKLFGEDSIQKKCAIVADGDLKPSDASGDVEPLDEDLKDLENTYVKVFRCNTTFERALVFAGTLEMLRATAEGCGLNTLENDIIEAQALLADGTMTREHRGVLADSVLKAAKRVGKARFAQVASKHAHLATALPRYINDAVQWVVEE
jgi:putative ATP-dependent endonuclease of OLD family